MRKPRTPKRRTPIRVISRRVIDLFDAMEQLEQRCSCAPDAIHQCDACNEWWRQHWKLHGELRLWPWEWPAYSNFEDDDPKAMQRYDALKAASDAAGPAR